MPGPQTSSEPTLRAKYQAVFDSALNSYEKKTGEVLSSNPLRRKLETCHSPNDIVTALGQQIPGSHQSRSSDDVLTNWLTPTVNVINAFSATISRAVGLAYEPAGLIFTAIGVLLAAANDANATRGALLDLFRRIETVFRRLEPYTEVPQTEMMTDAIVKVMSDVLCILAIATRDINQSRTKRFLKKLGRRKDIEVALQRLENVTVGEARKVANEALKATHVGDNVMDVDHEPEVHSVRGPHRAVEGVGRMVEKDFEYLIENQSRLDTARDWLSPPDPSLNYNIARSARHRGTLGWFTRSSTYRDWKRSGSLLWIHGESGSGKTVLASAIIQDIERISTTGSACMAYFFFDPRDTGKQHAHAFLSSILVQLGNQAVSFCNILLEFHSAHRHGSERPSDSALKQCLVQMLEVPGEVPIYLIVDALDECSDTSRMQSARHNVLEVIEGMVGFDLPNLHVCVTSRFKDNIRNVLEPLTSASNRVCLHDEVGQKKDITDYVSSVVYSGKAMTKWQEKDKASVINVLSDRADGVFQWVSCQIETLQRCLPSSVRRVLEELPKNLDETYERTLRDIPEANRVYAHRLLQCLTVAVRPLRVQELAEVLAMDFSTNVGIPTLNEDWRWDDQEHALLSACANLAEVVYFRDSRVVQFSHTSVREFLTSDRLAASMVDTPSCYNHISLELAHTIMAQACLSVLLRLEAPIDEEIMKKFPLADYAAKHFADHAEFGSVRTHIVDGIDCLLDEDKPFFASWMSHISSSWRAERNLGLFKASPLYHVTDLGYSGLVQHLISKRPGDVISSSGTHGTPVHVAARRQHLEVLQLLLPHCAGTDIRDSNGQTPLHVAASNALVEVAQVIIQQSVDMNVRDNSGRTPLHQAVDKYPLDNDRKLNMMRLLLDHGADVGAQDTEHFTPLHLAAKSGQLIVAQLLLEHGASIHAVDKNTWTPLHHASCGGYPDVIQLFLLRDANVEAQDVDGHTALHQAASQGKLSAAQRLLEHRANLHARNKWSHTPLHRASWYGNTEIIQLLFEHGADISAQDNNNETPLHMAAWKGKLSAAQLLLRLGASTRALSKQSWTPLFHASYYGHPDIVKLLLDGGEEIESRNDEHNTPLHVAVWQGKFAAAELLIKCGANIHALNKTNWTLLHQASYYGYPELIKLLLDRGASVQAQNSNRDTPLHSAAWQGKLAAAHLLLKRGANIRARNLWSHTPLYHASFYGCPFTIRLLLDHGADIEARSNDHHTPLHVAAWQGKVDAAKVLLECGATVHARNKIGWTPLHQASYYGYLDIISLLLDNKADIEGQCDDRNSPLHVAAWQGKLAVAQLLLSRGASIRALNMLSWTPLHQASWHGHPDVIQFLLEHGAEMEAQDCDTNTPLHLAARHGQLAAVRLLLEKGANTRAVNKSSYTPVQLASQNYRSDVVGLLSEHRADADT